MIDTNEEKISFVKALIYVATLDDSGVVDFERNYIASIAKAYGVNDNDIDKLYDEITNISCIDDVLSNIKDRKIKLLLLKELVALCFIDGNYDDKEKSGMIKICNLLNIEQSKLIEIETLIENLIQTEKQLVQALELED